MPRSKINTNTDLIIELYKKEKSVDYIAKKFGVSSTTIFRRLKENNIKIRGKGCKYNKSGNLYIKQHSCNENYFSKPNIENCYWAGFIAADGCITEDNSLSITLSIKDINHLKKFKNKIEYTGEIKIYTKKNKKKYCRIEIFNKNITNDLLNNFKITKRKTLILKPPDLKNKNHIKSFITGYIDGDGHTGVHQNIFYISVLGTKSMITWIRKYLLKFSLEKSSSKVYKSRNTYYIGFANKKARTIYQTFLNIKNDKLQRKWKYNFELQVNNEIS